MIAEKFFWMQIINCLSNDIYALHISPIVWFEKRPVAILNMTQNYHLESILERNRLKPRLKRGLFNVSVCGIKCPELMDWFWFFYVRKVIWSRVFLVIFHCLDIWRSPPLLYFMKVYDYRKEMMIFKHDFLET